MKGYRTLIAACIVAASCGEPTTGPTPTGRYTLTGSIRDLEGTMLADVPVVLAGQRLNRTTVTGANGKYSFDNVYGFFNLRISTDGYLPASRNVSVAADQVVDFVLEHIVVLTAGTTLRGTVRGQPCDPAGWDAKAPCQRVFFTPPTIGTLDLVLSWNSADELDLLIDPFYWSAPAGEREIRASLDIVSLGQHEIRINSYYQPQEFELRASFRPAR
jgi:hypothetical protein